MRTEWTAVQIFPAFQNIVACASNRTFVGLPLCACNHPFLTCDMTLRLFYAGRQQDFLDLTIDFAADLVKDRTILAFFPCSLRPCAHLSHLSCSVRRRSPLQIRRSTGQQGKKKRTLRGRLSQARVERSPRKNRGIRLYLGGSAGTREIVLHAPQARH